MTIKFCSDEILEIAVDIERNGREFYSKAAETVTDGAAKKLFSNLAQWEVRHEKIFTDMRKAIGASLQADTVLDPNGEEALYLQALADGEIFNPKLTGKEIIGDDTDPVAILEKALIREKDAVIFYFAMKKLVPESEYDAVDGIITEEMSHVRYISIEINRLKSL
ncbi:MAG: ferritin family protein [Planctomycetes bacterium]|nr:ferritin family protein [Planctomycetota bacterium]